MIDKQVEAIVQRLGQPRFQEGSRVVSSATGASYTIHNVTPLSATLRRAVPKVRGKAARKAEKRARRERWRRSL